MSIKEEAGGESTQFFNQIHSSPALKAHFLPSVVAPEVVTNSIITGYPPSKSTVYSHDTKAAVYMDFPESERSWK